MAEPLVVSNGNIQGNITSCELKDIVSGVRKDSVFSFTQAETHTVYDVCTKQVANTYTMPVFTGFVIVPIIAFFVIGFIFVAFKN